MQRSSTRNVPHGVEESALFDLLEGLSHEMGTPLTVLENNLSLVQNALQDDHADAEDVFALIEARSTEAARSADRLMSVLRAIRAGLGWRPGARLEPLRLDAVVSGAMRRLAAAPGRDGRLVADIQPTSTIPLDRGAVVKLLHHLVTNAFEASPPDGIMRVRVASHHMGAALSVEDDGPGVPPGADDAIYQPFYSTKPGAMGLGLCFARALVHAHEGELWHETRAGGGTRFTAWFSARHTVASRSVVATAPGALAERALREAPAARPDARAEAPGAAAAVLQIEPSGTIVAATREAQAITGSDPVRRKLWELTPDGGAVRELKGALADLATDEAGESREIVAKLHSGRTVGLELVAVAASPDAALVVLRPREG